MPVPAEGVEESPSGKQMNRLKPYMHWSISLPGAVNSSSTASSMITTGPPARTLERIADSTSTGRGMSCRHSKAKAASNGPTVSKVSPAATMNCTRSASPSADAAVRAASIEGTSTSMPTNLARG